MSGRTRLALCSAAATLLAACAMLPLVDPSIWLLEAAFLLVIQASVGAAARRVPLARPLTVAAQALTALLLLTLVFAHEQAFAGIVPTPDVFHQFGMLLQSGGQDVEQYAIPAPLTDGIQLMLMGGVLVIGLAVDTLAVTCRSAAPAGLPLLALYSVAAGLSSSAADWLWFLLAASGYLLLLLAEGRDRLSQWGRVFGGMQRPAGGRVTAGGLDSAGGGAIAPIRAGRRIGAVALAVAIAVPLMLPTLDGGLLDPTGHGTGVGTGGGGTISAVNPLVSLQNSLNQPEDREVLSYVRDHDQVEDQYLRIVSLDEFDGTTWKPSVRHITNVPKVLPTPQGLGTDVNRTQVNYTIRAADWYAQDWLPMPYPANQVEIDGRWRYEPVGRTLVGDHGQTTRGAAYRLSSLAVEPTARQLADAAPPPPELVREFTQVPTSLPPIVAATAREITHDAQNDYQRAVKLQDWFAQDGGFTYDTNVQAGTGPSAIARFLEQREGFCVHFAFSMAAMARTLAIPARVAVGFIPGTPTSDGGMTVGLKDAHAWPELYFEGVGWTRFEPTPTRGSVPAYTLPTAPDDPSIDPSAPSQADPSVPTPQPSISNTCPPDEKKIDGCGTAVPKGVGGSGNSGPPIGMIVAATLGGLVLLTLPLVPMLWRMRVRAVRRGTTGRTQADAATRTLAAWAELTDTAWDHGIVPDESNTPRKAAERIVRTARLDRAAEERVQRVAAAVEQVLYAPHPQPVGGLAEDVRQLHVALRAAVSRRSRLRAVFAPRSAVRLAWTIADRRRALGVRLARYSPAFLKTARPQG